MSISMRFTRVCIQAVTGGALSPSKLTEPAIEPELFFSFVIFGIIAAVTPGPNNVMLTTTGLNFGVRRGIPHLLGVCIGFPVMLALIGLGFGTLFQIFPLLHEIIKIIGVVYLLYLAWQAFSAPGSPLTADKQPAVQRRKLYFRGVVMNVTNPKVSIFFLAFLPQFISPLRGSVVVQTLVLGATFAVATILVFGGVALFAGALGQALSRSDRAQRILNRLAGAVFVALALKLLVTER